MNEVIEIIYRLRNGQSQRLIHRETKIGRKTVKKYYEFAEKNGWLSPEALMPTPEMVVERLASREKKVTEQHQTSSLESHKSVIKEWLRLNYTRKRIRQLLLSNFDVTVSYDTVKRYCRYLNSNPAERWSGKTRNWEYQSEVLLNPDKEDIVEVAVAKKETA